MAKKSFILLSMEDDKIKKISNVISNDSCRKILDFLANKEATESELASSLSLPISTVHYNLQQLMETGLISADEYHYSPKGKEVNHYRLANKYIIIAPKKAYGIKEKLKSILPVLLIVSGAAFVVQFTKKFFVQGATTTVFSKASQTIVRENIVMQKVAETVPAQYAVASAGTEAAKSAAQAAPEIINQTKEYITPPELVTQTITIPPSIWSNIALWFLMGALFALLVYLIIKIMRKDID